MKNVVLVYDELSKERGESLADQLRASGVKLARTGLIPIYAHATEDEIISTLYKLIFDADLVLGVSSSGNGISIYANKLKGFTAAPINSIDDAKCAIDLYNANAFDILENNQDLFQIFTTLIGKVCSE